MGSLTVFNNSITLYLFNWVPERKYCTFQSWTVTNQVPPYSQNLFFSIFLVVDLKMVTVEKTHMLHSSLGQSQITSQNLFSVSLVVDVKIVEKGNQRNLLHSNHRQSQITFPPSTQSIFSILWGGELSRNGKLKKKLIENFVAFRSSTVTYGWCARLLLKVAFEKKAF